MESDNSETEKIDWDEIREEKKEEEIDYTKKMKKQKYIKN